MFMPTAWNPRGWTIIKNKVIDSVKVVSKASVLGVFVFGFIPLLLGLLFDLVVVIPLRVPLHQTPVIFLWQDWALGVLLLKLAIAGLLLGPNTWLKADIEQVYQQGLRRLSLGSFISSSIMPVVLTILTCLAAPYFIGHSIPMLFELSHTMIYFLHWRLYPLLIIGVLFICFCIFEIKQFRRLCDHIKNERYLIGKRLQDYEPPVASASS